MTAGDLYPGQSAIVPEMLAAWKARNWADRAARHGEGLGWQAAAEDAQEWLLSLRRVWRALREARA